MASEDSKLINQHLEVLHDEVLDLTKAVEDRAELERDAAMLNFLDIIGPVIRALVQKEAGNRDVDSSKVVESFSEALPRLGLKPVGTLGQVFEIWPEQANEDYDLGQIMPDSATLVRVEVLSRGWFFGNKVIARPIGRVLEVIDEDENKGTP